MSGRGVAYQRLKNFLEELAGKNGKGAHDHESYKHVAEHVVGQTPEGSDAQAREKKRYGKGDSRKDPGCERHVAGNQVPKKSERQND